MTLIMSDEKMKELLKEIMIELMKEKRDLFYEIILEAIEESGLAQAINEGRKDDFVSEARIMEILEG